MSKRQKKQIKKTLKELLGCAVFGALWAMLLIIGF